MEAVFDRRAEAGFLLGKKLWGTDAPSGVVGLLIDQANAVMFPFTILKGV